MATVTTDDGLALYAEAHGEGIPILFSCAFSTTHENWRPQVEPLVRAGARVILWDYRGHGRSDAPHDPDAYTMELVIDDLGRVLEWAVGNEPAVLAGLSFGGLSSLHFAARKLDQVRGLLLVAAGPGFKNPEAAAEWKVRTERTAAYIETRGFEAFVGGKAGPTCIGRNPGLPAAKAAAAAIIAQDPTAVGLFARRVSALAPSVIDELRGLMRPALVPAKPKPYNSSDMVAMSAPKLTSPTPRKRKSCW